MSNPTKQQIKSALTLIDLEPNTKLIDCPLHGDHKAILFCRPHKYGGIWECYISGASDSHDHYRADEQGKAEIEVETGESWPSSALDNPSEFSYYVCSGEEGCGVILDGDPIQDRQGSDYEI